VPESKDMLKKNNQMYQKDAGSNLKGFPKAKAGAIQATNKERNPGEGVKSSLREIPMSK
jgi:hypothetical protein